MSQILFADRSTLPMLYYIEPVTAAFTYKRIHV